MRRDEGFEMALFGSERLVAGWVRFTYRMFRRESSPDRRFRIFLRVVPTISYYQLRFGVKNK